MSATQLLLHHRYRNNMAYDWSRLNNHGYLVSVQTGSGTPASPNHLLFQGGADRVEVRPSETLRDFGELRLRAVFRPEPGGAARRYNLIEGEFAFALFMEGDNSIFATINSPTAGWIGPQSAPGLVTFGKWHEANFIHDGISHGRLYLDDQLVGERWDMAGPIGNLGGRGVYMGHWPGDDRYTFVGQLAEIQIWKDDPKKDSSPAIDDCCLDKAWLDQRVSQARRRGWEADAARDSIATFFSHARGAAAEVRDGDQARAAAIATLTQQAINAMSVRDADGMENTLGSLLTLVTNQLGSSRMDQLGHELWDLLRATPVGEWLGGSDKEVIAFLEEAAARMCLDGIVPDRKRDDERPKPPDRGGQPPGDPDIDHDPPKDPEPANEPDERPPGEPEYPPEPDDDDKPDDDKPDEDKPDDSERPL